MKTKHSGMSGYIETATCLHVLTLIETINDLAKFVLRRMVRGFLGVTFSRFSRYAAPIRD